jgi:hypothetical protein
MSMNQPLDGTTRRALVNAMVNEWIVNCFCSASEDDEPPEEKRKEYEQMTDEQLFEEAMIDEEYTVERYIERYRQIAPGYRARFDDRIDPVEGYTEQQRSDIEKAIDIINSATKSDD